METMMKRGRGQLRSSPSYDDAEFFKVFIPCRNSQQLKIPMSFVQEFGETIHEKTTLKGYDGKLWNVDIENTDEGLFMNNGWANFVNHYCLREGEFLVFKYLGNFTFLVKIFGTNGCKTEAIPPPTIVREVKIEEESEEQEVIQVCEMPSSKQPRGSKKAQKVSSQIVEGEPVPPPTIVRKMRIKEESESEEVQKICEMPSSSKQPRASKKEQKVSSQLVKRKPVVTEDPYFIKPVNYKQRRNLTIPTVMFDVHNIRVRPEMVLRTEKGEIWPVKVHKCADGRVLFGSGWEKFWQQNNIRGCDTCKFTFLKGGSSKEIKVEILRGQAK